ncbi:MAG: fumarate hydratase C-terminal domain-containing protein [SAR324 cluster bacterium]|nr:fumarate hydratase C-terminal domain-containing protein [SAR324 cluster bacterium]MCZ6557838.1 fumarate hydratase C-terminal domain-containing protein [SAR324 cluster bacterium]MCZ6626885.1 fumarate hydratase C-terminal domain-containing protein [SAR324 cluster bacterium]MCZ6729594.1 fumarate hydratase C-terminal domain-containing protein [SAR324 cluster bacterium]MCZ6843359.1 fumarate hydratase C-terminal domain-containing protein [SAR324 cluster bacterium]
MDTVRLKCPVDAEALRKLKLGDLVFLDGPLFTGREGVYKRYLAEGVDPPVPFREISNVNFHCSPAAKILPEGGYEVKAVTATASFRFGKWMPAWLEKTGVKLIIGKGGMTTEDYRRTFVPNQAVYLTTVGYGLGATYGRGIAGVRAVYWLEELGIAQAMWVLDCAGMGPFIVESDAEGNSLFELSNREINRNLGKLYEGLPEPALRRFGEITNREDEVL